MLSERHLSWPSAPDPGVSTPIVYRQFFTHLRETSLRSAKGHADRVAPIRRLLSSCRPSAVGRFIVPVAVDAIDRVRRGGPRAHVGEEVFESLPSVAYANASTAIIGEPFGAGVRATFAHAAPRLPFWGAGTSVRCCRMILTAAGLSAASQVGITHGPFGAAGTSAQPPLLAVRRGSCRANDGQIEEDMTGQIRGSTHAIS